MKNTRKNTSSSSSPAWHIGAQAFIALLIIIIVPLAINVKSMISTVVSNTNFPSNTPKKVVAEPQKNKTTLTRFLAAAVFGVDPDTNVVENSDTGHETIILPYGGQTDAGGTISGTGDVQSDRWIGNGPSSDGSVPVIYKYQYPLPNATSAPINGGGNIGGGNTNAGGNIPAGGTIKSGGTI